MFSRFEDRVDTTNAIWEKLYLVTVPEIHATSEAFVRQYGTPITMDRQVDRTLSNQWFTRYMTINDMVDLWREGSHVRIHSEKDIKDIYDTLAAHLEGWKHQLERGINIGGAPLDDLIAMDDFANAVYKHARHHLTQDIVDSIFAKHLSASAGVTPGNFFARPVVPTETDSAKIQQQIEDNLPKRDSLGDFLKHRLVSLNRR